MEGDNHEQVKGRSCEKPLPESETNTITIGGEANINSIELENDENLPMPRTELDSHANMVVLGRNAFIFDRVSNQTCEVMPFDPSLGSAHDVPIIDGAIAYECPYNHKTFILIFKNALHVPSLEHNLIPPFILREAGIKVNDTAKIHKSEPSNEDHSIIIEDESLTIPLQLNGIFSYFHSRCPTIDEINHSPSIIMTPDSITWDPYSDHFAINEESMLDHEGKMMDREYWKRHCPGIKSISSIPTSVYESVVDRIMSSDNPYDLINAGRTSNSMATAMVSSLAKAVTDKAVDAKVGIALGITGKFNSKCNLFQEDPPTSYDRIIESNISPDISTAIGGKRKGVSAEFLSKIWRIKHDEAEKVLQQSTQLKRQGAENALSRRFSTNDRMLRYNRINSVFFTDTFFVTSTGKSTRGNTCAQLFVSDKGYAALYPMKSKSEFHSALKQFCKEIGIPNTTWFVIPRGNSHLPK